MDKSKGKTKKKKAKAKVVSMFGKGAKMFSAIQSTHWNTAPVGN